MARKSFSPGDRVRYTGKFLRNTGQHKGSAGTARGTVVGPIPGMAGAVGVRWDGGSDLADHLYRDDPEYLSHVRTYGVAVLADNLERSPT